jgi:hypothetical protein
MRALTQGCLHTKIIHRLAVDSLLVRPLASRPGPRAARTSPGPKSYELLPDPPYQDLVLTRYPLPPLSREPASQSAFLGGSYRSTNPLPWHLPVFTQFLSGETDSPRDDALAIKSRLI